MLKKKFGPIFKELYNFLPKKWSLSSQKYESGIRDPEKIYSGSRIPGSKRHRIPDPQHCLQLNIFMSSDFDTGTFLEGIPTYEREDLKLLPVLLHLLVDFDGTIGPFLDNF